MQQPESVVLTVCETCDGADWRALCDRLARAALAVPVEVRRQDCMNGCGAPATLALQGQGRATCFFAGVDPVADAEDIVATVCAYVDAPGGWIEEARACGRLRFCMVGRVPAI